MPIKYKIIERGQPGVTGGGTKKFYAKIVYDGELTIDDLVSRIEKFSALSEADIKGVIIALENVIQETLSESKIVRLEKLGTLYPGISSEGTTTEKEFTSSHIKSIKVNYRAGKRILARMKESGFEKKQK